MSSGVRTGLSGASRIILATAIGGGAGYLLTLLVAARLGSSDYARFGVLWSLIFFAVAVLGGVQQEFARATRPARESEPPGFHARRTVLICTAAVSTATLATSPFWSALMTVDSGPALVAPLVTGLCGYLVTASLVGVLYGLGSWTAVAVMIAADGSLRLLLVGIALAAGPSLLTLAWCVAAPFVIVPAASWVILRRRIVGAYRLDAPTMSLLRNIASTVGGSAATGVLVSGYSAALALTSPGVPAATLGAVVFAVNLARAPLVIVVLSLQSFLVVQFRDAPGWRRLLAVVLVGVVGVAAVLAAVAWLVGPAVVGVFGSGYRLPGWLLTAIVASGGLVGALCATGAAVVSRPMHGVFALGWGASAVGALVILILPVPFEARVALSLTSPVIGLAVHLTALARRAQSSGG